MTEQNPASEPIEWCADCAEDISSLLVREAHFMHRVVCRPVDGWASCSCNACMFVRDQMADKSASRGGAE